VSGGKRGKDLQPEIRMAAKRTLGRAARHGNPVVFYNRNRGASRLCRKPTRHTTRNLDTRSGSRGRAGHGGSERDGGHLPVPCNQQPPEKISTRAGPRATAEAGCLPRQALTNLNGFRGRATLDRSFDPPITSSSTAGSCVARCAATGEMGMLSGSLHVGSCSRQIFHCRGLTWGAVRTVADVKAAATFGARFTSSCVRQTRVTKPSGTTRPVQH